MLKQSVTLLQRIGTSKFLAGFVIIVFAVCLCGVAGQSAYADTQVITGGSTISENGDYQLATDARGTITIDEGLDNVKIIGNGVANYNDGMNIKVGEGSALTIENLYGNVANGFSYIDFQGSGALNIEGTNLIDNAQIDIYSAVINVPYGNTVVFGGSGYLYGYKSTLCGYIGSNSGEANGNIIFENGHWFLKGSKTGAIIGGASETQKGGDVTINGGELYLKGVARGALIGCSFDGLSGDVYINGGLIELWQDFTGPAIGAENSASVGSVTITGGSLKTVRSSNSWNSYKAPADFNGMPTVTTAAVNATGADNYQILTFDASSYETSGVDVSIDGKSFYKGGTYAYVTNEVKNPTADATEGAINDTMANWLTNDEKWLITEANYSNAYPNKSGSSLVKDNNLYFWLTKEDHTMTINGEDYLISYDATTNSFAYGESFVSAALTTSSDIIKVGDKFTVSVTMKGDNLAGGSGVLSYDKNALTLLSIKQGSGLSIGEVEGETKATFLANTSTGMFGFANNSAETDTGIVVATYEFEAKAATDSIAISFSAVDVAGSNSLDEIEVTIVSDEYTNPVIAANVTKGDVNNNGKISVVDAQIVHDLINAVYGEDWEDFPFTASDHIAGWTKATLSYVADVQGADGVVDANDAYAILYYVINNSWS
jgi:hypothetical protein